MTDITEREALARADTADAILQHPLIAQALDHYVQELTTAWQQSKHSEAQEREEVYRRLKAAEHFRAYLTETINAGKVIRARAPKSSIPYRVLRDLRAIGGL